MGLEYESLADYSLQESQFYEQTIDIYDMSTTQLSGKLGSTIKRNSNKKTKRVTFQQNFVQVSHFFFIYEFSKISFYLGVKCVILIYRILY